MFQNAIQLAVSRKDVGKKSAKVLATTPIVTMGRSRELRHKQNTFNLISFFRLVEPRMFSTARILENFFHWKIINSDRKVRIKENANTSRAKIQICKVSLHLYTKF